MDKAFIDTSVILRVLVQDDPVKVDAVEALLAEARESGHRIHVLPVVMLEIVWVLEKLYKLKKAAIRELAEAILNTPELKIEGDALFRSALADYEERNVKFADAVIARWGMSRGLETVYTYDEKDYRRIPGIRVVRP